MIRCSIRHYGCIVEEVVEYLQRRFIPIGWRITSLEREEVPVIPIEASRASER